MPVGRPDLAVLELVAALGIRLDQPDHVVLADETEPAVSNLNRGQEVAEVHPSVGIHLEAVPLREMPQDPGHRATEQLDLFVVQQELPFTAAVRAEFLPEISVRTTFLEHRALLGSFGIRRRFKKFRPRDPTGGRPPGRCGGRAIRVVSRSPGPQASRGPCGAGRRESPLPSARWPDRASQASSR